MNIYLLKTTAVWNFQPYKDIYIYNYHKWRRTITFLFDTYMYISTTFSGLLQGHGTSQRTETCPCRASAQSAFQRSRWKWAVVDKTSRRENKSLESLGI